MRSDNDGEEGIIALGGLATSAEPAESRWRWLVLIGIAGAALFYGDGIITPAISVTSAVEGLQVATPHEAHVSWIDTRPLHPEELRPLVMSLLPYGLRSKHPST